MLPSTGYEMFFGPAQKINNGPKTNDTSHGIPEAGSGHPGLAGHPRAHHLPSGRGMLIILMGVNDSECCFAKWASESSINDMVYNGSVTAFCIYSKYKFY